jgi:hypothetical protein
LRDPIPAADHPAAGTAPPVAPILGSRGLTTATLPPGSQKTGVEGAQGRCELLDVAMTPGVEATPMAAQSPGDVSAAALPESSLAAAPMRSGPMAEAHHQAKPAAASLPSALALLSPRESKSSASESTAAAASYDAAASPARQSRADAVQSRGGSGDVSDGEGRFAATQADSGTGDEVRGGSTFAFAQALSEETDTEGAPDAAAFESAVAIDGGTSAAALLQRADAAHVLRRAVFAAMAEQDEAPPILTPVGGDTRRVNLVGLALAAVAGQFLAKHRAEPATPGGTCLLPPRRRSIR